MDPLQSGLFTFTQHFAASINAGQVPEASGLQTLHPAILSLADMSWNALFALEQTNAQQQPLAMQAIQSIGDYALSCQSIQGAEAHYTDDNLTVHVRLNEQSRYDVISISSPSTTEPIYLSAPPPPLITHGDADSVMDSQPPSVFSQLAAQSSRGQLTAALIRLNSPPDSSGAPLPSGVSTRTPSMVFSHDGSASLSTAIVGPSRTLADRRTRTRPYPASSPSGTTKGKRLQRPSATEEEIEQRLRNKDGSFRTVQVILDSLHAAERGADTTRIMSHLRAAGGQRHMPSATNEEIKKHLLNDDGTLRTHTAVVKAVHDAGKGAGNERILVLLQALQRETDDEIKTHLRNDDGTLRNREAVVGSLNAAGKRVGHERINKLLREARLPPEVIWQA
jgi:hypothetical protein